jgi:site-specific DNA recombinase
MSTVTESLRAAIYNRVSDDRGGRSTSTDDQDAESCEHCDASGWTIAERYTEPGSASASRFATKARDVWARLLRDLRAGRFDVLVVWETSRAGRKMAPWVELIDTCRDLGVLVHVTSHERTYDPRNWRDRKTLLEEGISNEGSSEETSKRVLRASRASARAGLPYGRIPYGYRREYDPATGALLRQVPDEDQQPIVTEVFRRFAGGESGYAICMDFERRGVPVAYRRDLAKRRHPENPPAWDLARLRQMITCQAYIAQRVHRGVVVGPAAWPPLIDDETFRLCQKRLADDARRMNRGKNAPEHLLSGATFCAVCGGHMRKLDQHGAMVYQCRGRGGDFTRGRYHVTISADDLETYIRARVLRRLARPDALDLMTADHSAEAAAAAAELLTAQEQHREAVAALAAGTMSVAAFTAVEGPMLARVNAAKERAHADVPPVLREIAGPDAPARWKALAPDQRRAVVLAIMDIRVSRAAVRGPIPRGADRQAVTASRAEIVWKTA